MIVDKINLHYKEFGFIIDEEIEFLLANTKIRITFPNLHTLTIIAKLNTMGYKGLVFRNKLYIYVAINNELLEIFTKIDNFKPAPTYTLTSLM